MKVKATYSPEDNKIRLYPSERLDAEAYEKVKAHGFLWAPKQGLFVAPRWSPKREDLAISLAGELEPEHMTLPHRRYYHDQVLHSQPLLWRDPVHRRD